MAFCDQGTWLQTRLVAAASHRSLARVLREEMLEVPSNEGFEGSSPIPDLAAPVAGSATSAGTG